MGAWGVGNFDNDTVADHLSELTSRLLNDIAAAMSNPSELEPEEYWGCAVPVNIELLNLIANQGWVGTALPEPAMVMQWQTTYMAVWDGYIDELKPDAAYKAQRRAILLATFDELLAHARRRYDG